MFEESLGWLEGMLFVFPDERVRKFWMKNTLVPLDIVFVSSEGVVVGVVTARPCTESSCELFVSEMPAKFVVEVNAGFARSHRIVRGARVVLDQ